MLFTEFQKEVRELILKHIPVASVTHEEEDMIVFSIDMNPGDDSRPRPRPEEYSIEFTEGD